MEGVEGVYGILTGSAFGINGCKVADGGREDSNGLLIGFSLLGVSGVVTLLSSAKHQLVNHQWLWA